MDNIVNKLGCFAVPQEGNRFGTQSEPGINQAQILSLDEALELLANAIETYAVLTNSLLSTPQLEQAGEELAYLTALCQHLSKAQQ